MEVQYPDRLQSKITGAGGTVPIASFAGLSELQRSPVRTLHLGYELALQMRLSTNRNELLIVAFGGTCILQRSRAYHTRL